MMTTKKMHNLNKKKNEIVINIYEKSMKMCFKILGHILKRKVKNKLGEKWGSSIDDPQDNLESLNQTATLCNQRSQGLHNTFNIVLPY